MTHAALILGVVLGTGALFLVLLDRIAVGLLRPPERAYPRRVDDLPFPHEELSIPAGAHRLHGWLLRPSARAAPRASLVILVHGWASNSGEMLEVAEPLLERGHPSLLVDLRSHGRSGKSGDLTIRHYRDDVAAAARYAADRFPASIRVLAGHSLGGGVAAVAAAEGAPVQGVVLMGAPADFLQIWAEYMSDRGLPGRLLVRSFYPFWRVRAGVPYDALQPERRLGEVGVPVLVLHGAEDRRVSAGHARRLAAAAGVPVETVEGAGHGEMLAAPALHRRLARFLERLEAGGEGAPRRPPPRR